MYEEEDINLKNLISIQEPFRIMGLLKLFVLF